MKSSNKIILNRARVKSFRKWPVKKVRISRHQVIDPAKLMRMTFMMGVKWTLEQMDSFTPEQVAATLK